MIGIKNLQQKRSTLAGVLLLAFSPAYAATVPPGTALAAQQQMVINNGSEVSSLDPHKTEGVPESNIIHNLLDGLVNTDNSGQVVPGVAKSWENPQPTVWIFNLRDDAKWSNGEPVTANDFVYSWRRLVDPKTASPYSSYPQAAHFANIDAILAGKASPDQLGVKALDAHRLQITLSEPVPYLVAMLAHTAMKPVYEPAIKQWGEAWTRPGHYIGNGAYTLDDWIVNEKIVLKRNPQYWDNAHTVIEQGTFLPIASENSDINRYRSGGTDMTNSAVPPEMFGKLRKELGDEVKVSPLLCTFYYEINNKKAPFTDARVRAALKMTLDREVIANKIMAQGQIPAYSLTPPFTAGIKLTPPAWFTWTQAQRNEAAKKLLTEAGFDAAHPLTFTLLYNTSDQNKRQAIAAASMWQKNLGAKVALQNQEWKTMLETRHQAQYDVVRATWCADYNEPSTFLNMLISNASINTAFYSSATFDRLMKETLTAGSEAQRADLYQQAETQLDKDSPIVPVYYRVSVRLVKPWVGGFTGKDPQDMTDLKYYFIKQH
ncbi:MULTISPECIES: ABC transporter substrate-binding protein [unclassified Pantoea]|uniref:ABC transporter substrate-binding protein n=1 Tax=unclassified Pantoea TaxID=2630326 RepID=UPI0023DB1965|nr:MULTISPECIES: ABC transporter substrate-binding protein [unclassified Pantoea]MDF2043078.1 ABC transporter substrate-binding protein [Pantoea sp. Cr_R14]MDF2070973.1 ABC transporter substrate-binding protein [Pantoea sp. Cr_R13]MDF2080102.1 ABC transporter substrate-binding protein [Pantoea sp. Cr_R21]